MSKKLSIYYISLLLMVIVDVVVILINIEQKNTIKIKELKSENLKNVLFNNIAYGNSILHNIENVFLNEQFFDAKKNNCMYYVYNNIGCDYCNLGDLSMISDKKKSLSNCAIIIIALLDKSLCDIEKVKSDLKNFEYYIVDINDHSFFNLIKDKQLRMFFYRYNEKLIMPFIVDYESDMLVDEYLKIISDWK